MSLTSLDDLYSGNIPYNLTEASYLDNWNNEPIYLSGIETEINIEYFKNNSIKAIVNATDDTFINFSQNYFPGWKAYINGEAVQIYKVNDIIQGTFVPNGESIIEFKFIPSIFIIGGSFTLLTVSIIIFVLYNQIKRYKKNG